MMDCVVNWESRGNTLLPDGVGFLAVQLARARVRLGGLRPASAALHGLATPAGFCRLLPVPLVRDSQLVRRVPTLGRDLLASCFRQVLKPHRYPPLSERSSQASHQA